MKFKHNRGDKMIKILIWVWETEEPDQRSDVNEDIYDLKIET